MIARAVILFAMVTALCYGRGIRPSMSRIGETQ